jgi:hypothetical protein
MYTYIFMYIYVLKRLITRLMVGKRAAYGIVLE